MSEIHIVDAHVMSVRADLVKGTARIVLEASLNVAVLRAKAELAALAIQELPVDVTISSSRPQLFQVEIMPLGDGEVAA